MENFFDKTVWTHIEPEKDNTVTLPVEQYKRLKLIEAKYVENKNFEQEREDFKKKETAFRNEKAQFMSGMVKYEKKIGDYGFLGSGTLLESYFISQDDAVSQIVREKKLQLKDEYDEALKNIKLEGERREKEWRAIIAGSFISLLKRRSEFKKQDKRIER